MEIFKPDFITLPWATLLAIASGYTAYYIANVGIREHHKASDVIFSILVFGFLAAFAYNICRIVLDISLVWSSAISFAFAALVGAAWSIFGRNLFEGFLRRSRISHADNLPSAWVALFGIRIPATQLSVN